MLFTDAPGATETPFQVTSNAPNMTDENGDVNQATAPLFPRANQLFKLGNNIRRGTGILPVFFGHGQDARAT